MYFSPNKPSIKHGYILAANNRRPVCRTLRTQVGHLPRSGKCHEPTLRLGFGEAADARSGLSDRSEFRLWRLGASFARIDNSGAKVFFETPTSRACACARATAPYSDRHRTGHHFLRRGVPSASWYAQARQSSHCCRASSPTVPIGRQSNDRIQS